jgi:hypothetical protein
MLKIKQRDCDIQDFLKNKKKEPWKFQRDKVAKPANFSLIFGMAAITFAGVLEKEVFTEQECEDFIHDAKIESILTELCLSGKYPPKKCKYIAVAQFMREAFFSSYKGLAERLTRELLFAKQNGYVRSWHGPVRHLSQLSYMKFNKSGNLIGLDKELYSKMFSGLKNDSGNSTIQTVESCFTQMSFIEQSYYIKKWNLKSRLWNQCHDSGDYWIYVGDGDNDPDNEAELMSALIYHCDTKVREPYYGIPMDIDAEIADVSTDELLETNYYHGGDSVKFIDLNKAVENWNNKHDNKIEYKDLDALTWQL